MGKLIFSITVNMVESWLLQWIWQNHSNLLWFYISVWPLQNHDELSWFWHTPRNTKYTLNGGKNVYTKNRDRGEDFESFSYLKGELTFLINPQMLYKS